MAMAIKLNASVFEGANCNGLGYAYRILALENPYLEDRKEMEE
jgi:hypothetical protein